MKKIIHNHYISSFLLTIFFLVHGYTEYREFIGWRNILILAIFYLIVVLISYQVWRRIFSDSRKASLLNVALFLVFFFFSAFHQFLKRNFPDQLISGYSFLLPAVAVSFLGFLIYLKKVKSISIRIFQYINLCLIVFILWDFVEFGLSLTRFDIKERSSFSESKTSLNLTHKPSIYLLVFDEYSGSRLLKKEYGYTNVLDSMLIKQGFHIFNNSRSNYNFTTFSIASLLNYHYLSFPIDTNRISYKDYLQAEEAIYNNSTARLLESQGYSIRNLSLFDWEHHPALQSYYLFPRGTLLIRNRTFFLYIYQHLGWHLTTVDWPFLNQWEKKIYSTLSYNIQVEKELVKATEPVDHPQFVYAHFMMPHPPFFFKKDGSPRAKDEVLYDERNHLYPIDKYLDNVHYTNQKIETLVSLLQKKEKNNAVIIIVGDHGFRQNNPSREAYFSNFNAVYLPPALLPVHFPESISLVNQFRFIFNQCTNSSMPYMQDKEYFLTDAESE
jgi:hypothetical protein